MFVAQIAVCLSLVLDAPVGSPATVDAAAEKALATLPGKTAFVFTELADDGPRTLFGVRADERFAVGSTFKLFIFGNLVEEVNAGRRRMDDTMLLRRDLAGPPSSEMADWPAGSPVTLYTLALKMITISDNTATDHLLYLLGRQRVERQMQAMTGDDLAINRPLLSTREMTMLRDRKQGLPGRAYRKLDEAARRKYLDEHFQGVPDYDALDFDTSAYDVAEWYASPLQIARALAWIQSHTAADQPAHLLRAILAVDPKLKLSASRWPFVGFKGGSEDQLLAGNWLLESSTGRWYTYHVYCNSPSEAVKPEVFVKAVEEILRAVEASVAGAR